MDISFNIKAIEIAVRKILCKEKESLTESDLAEIKYVALDLDHHNEIHLSKTTPPVPYVPTQCGDEWECCCAGEENIDKFIQSLFDKKCLGKGARFQTSLLKIRSFERSVVCFNEEGLSEKEKESIEEEARLKSLRSFQEFARFVQKKQADWKASGKELNPEIRKMLEAEAKIEYKELKASEKKVESSAVVEEKEKLPEWYDLDSKLFAEDLCNFKGVVVLRLFGLGENLDFLKGMKDLAVLEVGNSDVDVDAVKKVSSQLKQLCVWAN